ncbi:MAG: ATP synthase F1 subunit epsilon [Alphaproteobacteria bacterium]
MSAQINFELVSPEEKLVSEDVYLAEIPGDNGVFGVAAGHCSLVSSLKPGVVKLHKEQDGDVRKIFIAGGFADVTAQSCTILAEEAIDVKDLNQESLEQYLVDLNEDLGLVEEDADKDRVKGRIALTKAKLFAITGY